MKRFELVLFLIMSVSCSDHSFEAGKSENVQLASNMHNSANQDSADAEQNKEITFDDFGEGITIGNGNNNDEEIAEEVAEPGLIIGSYLTCIISAPNAVTCRSEQAINFADLDSIAYIDENDNEIPRSAIDIRIHGEFLVEITISNDYILKTIKNKNEIASNAQDSSAVMSGGPLPGGDGVINDLGATFNSITLSWSKALSPDGDDQNISFSYCIYRSDNEIKSIAEAEAASMVGACSSDIETITDSGLLPTTGYYYNVVVEGPQGAKSAYNGIYVQTAAAFHIVYTGFEGGTDNFLKYTSNRSGERETSTLLQHNRRFLHVDFDKDQNQDLHILYFDSENVDNETGDLIYMFGNVGQGFTSETIAPTEKIQDGSDISVSPDGTAHIVYSEEWLTGNQENGLFYRTGKFGDLSEAELLTSNNPTADQSWGVDSFLDAAGNFHFSFLDEVSESFVYGSGVSGNFNLTPIEFNTSEDMNTTTAIIQAQDGTVHVAYYDGSDNGGTNTLFYENNGSGGFDGGSATVATGANTGQNLDIAVDSSENVHMCYRDLANGNTYYTSNASGNWVRELIHDGTTTLGEGCSTCSIGVGSTRDTVHIVYYSDCATRTLRHAYGSAGNWTDLEIDTNVSAFDHNHELIVD